MCPRQIGENACTCGVAEIVNQTTTGLQLGSVTIAIGFMTTIINIYFMKFRSENKTAGVDEYEAL